jgi:hypothetical protein
MTAALNFNMSSTPAAPVVDHLAVPVVATVTATPPNLDLRPLAVAAVAPPHNIVTGGTLRVVGLGGNNPSPAQLAPVTLQTGLSASAPREGSMAQVSPASRSARRFRTRTWGSRVR